MPYKDRAEALACKKRYRQRHKEKVNAAARDYKREQRQFKRDLLSRYCCIACKETDADLIDWHHINPEDKSFGIIAGNSYSLESWWDEVLKCVPLCAMCHRKLHKDKLCLIPQPIPVR